MRVALAALAALALLARLAAAEAAPDTLVRAGAGVDAAEVHSEVAAVGEVLGTRTEWPFSVADSARAVDDALSPEAIDALFTWAEGPNIGLLSGTVVTMTAPGQRARLADALRRCQQHATLVDELRDRRDPMLRQLLGRHLLSSVEVAVLTNAEVAPLMLWYRLEDAAGTSADVREREGWSRQLTSLFAYALIPREPAIVGDADAGTLVALDRRLTARPIGERLDFGDRFLRAYSALRERHYGRAIIRFDRPSPRLRRFLHDVTAAADSVAR